MAYGNLPLVSTLLFLLTACESSTLGKDDQLTLTTQPSLLYPLEEAGDPAAAAAPMPRAPSREECLTGGGAIVHVLGHGADGREASGRHVTLYLKPANAGTLAVIASEHDDADDLATGSIALTLDERGNGAACLFPGAEAGSIVINGRSGVVVATETVTVAPRRLPANSSMIIGLSRMLTRLPSTANRCGATMEDCRPGVGRYFQVAVRAVAPASGLGVPAGAGLALVAEGGWLTQADEDCDAAHRSSLALAFENEVAEARWCFGDNPDRAKLTAMSGLIVATVEESVPAIPRQVTLSASRSSASAGDSIDFEAVVSDCAGGPVSGEHVFIHTTAGSLDLPTGTAGETSTAGIVRFTGRVPESAGAGTVTVGVGLSLASAIDCDVAVEVRP